jgi:hypothetical protein
MAVVVSRRSTAEQAATNTMMDAAEEISGRGKQRLGSAKKRKTDAAAAAAATAEAAEAAEAAAAAAAAAAQLERVAALVPAALLERLAGVAAAEAGAADAAAHPQQIAVQLNRELAQRQAPPLFMDDAGQLLAGPSRAQVEYEKISP